MTEFLLNPAHRDALLAQMESAARDITKPEAFGLSLGGMPVTFSDYIPARASHEEWRPPEGDRFAEYGPEDEAWMRPLGLGRLVSVDDGPVIYAVDWDQLYRPHSRLLPTTIWGL